MTAPFDATRDHRISLDEAAGLIKAYQAQAVPGAHLASAFNRSAFEQLLAQPGAAGIRIYLAHHTNGSPTMVMVAVDETGSDLASASNLCMQNSHDCPPICLGTRLGA